MKTSEFDTKVRNILKKHQEHGVRYAIDDFKALFDEVAEEIIPKRELLSEEEMAADMARSPSLQFNRGYNTAIDQMRETKKRILS